MIDYLRVYILDATWFFTVNFAERRGNLCWLKRLIRYEQLFVI